LARQNAQNSLNKSGPTAVHTEQLERESLAVERRLGDRLGHLEPMTMGSINRAIRLSLAC
jgi:mRNA-degrading endonuclease toxin of MazEF toxin-antitoxin module